MSDDKIRQRLLALASAEDRATFTRIRDLFPEIEAALQAGVKRAQIVQALNEEGIRISPEVFTNYVIRLKRAQAVEHDRAARAIDPSRPASQAGALTGTTSPADRPQTRTAASATPTPRPRGKKEHSS